MKRLIIGQLACVLALGSFATMAHAAPKKGKAKAAQHQEAPDSAEISKSMGDLKWGTSRDEVLQHFLNAVKDKYKPLIAKTTGAIEEDKLRAKMRDELARIRSSLVEFNGTKTGWDVSFLKGEFTHNNGESMFVVTDENSQNYYFFIQGKLWKWYKAFNASVFQGKGFDAFAQSVQGRFGQAVQREGELVDGSGKQRWLEWKDPSTRLRAVDNNQFYGFYCLVFESKDTLGRLADLRTSRPDSGKATNAMVDAVTSDEAEEPDSNKNVIDRITGKIRQREDAPAPTAGKNGKSTKAASAAPAQSSGPSVSREDDPLSGL
jgi:hypothetical protein